LVTPFRSLFFFLVTLSRSVVLPRVHTFSGFSPLFPSPELFFFFPWSRQETMSGTPPPPRLAPCVCKTKRVACPLPINCPLFLFFFFPHPVEAPLRWFLVVIMNAFSLFLLSHSFFFFLFGLGEVPSKVAPIGWVRPPPSPILFTGPDGFPRNRREQLSGRVQDGGNFPPFLFVSFDVPFSPNRHLSMAAFFFSFPADYETLKVQLDIFFQAFSRLFPRVVILLGDGPSPPKSAER